MNSYYISSNDAIPINLSKFGMELKVQHITNWFWKTKHMIMSENGNAFHIIGPLWGESIGHGWIPS